MATETTPQHQHPTAELERAVIASLAGMLKLDPDTIQPATRFFEDLSFDSTRVLDLLMQLEHDLGVEFDAETLEPADFTTVAALTAYVARRSEPGA
jgi:acyl carrier protein